MVARHVNTQNAGISGKRISGVAGGLGIESRRFRTASDATSGNPRASLKAGHYEGPKRLEVSDGDSKFYRRIAQSSVGGEEDHRLVHHHGGGVYQPGNAGDHRADGGGDRGGVPGG